MNKYNIIEKQSNNKQLTGCKSDCIFAGRPTYKFPCDKCASNNFKFYKNKE